MIILFSLQQQDDNYCEKFNMFNLAFKLFHLTKYLPKPGENHLGINTFGHLGNFTWGVKVPEQKQNSSKTSVQNATTWKGANFKIQNIIKIKA